MSASKPLPPAPRALTDASRTRWEELLCGIASLLPAGTASVLVDGHGTEPAVLAGRLAERVPTATVQCPDGPRGGHGARGSRGGRGARGARGLGGERWDVVIWARAEAGGSAGNGETGADIVVDMHDPEWPVIRRVAAPLAGRGQWYLAETRAFFAARAATWDTRFGDDLPAYAAAIGEAGIPRGGVVVDVGCGTGRALPALRRAVGPGGTVVAIDITPEMLDEARCPARAAQAALVLADARVLPLADARADAVFAAGLVTHLPDSLAGLSELARVTRSGGLLVLFHPSGRAALAARHGRTLTPDEPLAAGPLERLTQASGWRLTAYDDAEHRFFARAVRE